MLACQNAACHECHDLAGKGSFHIFKASLSFVDRRCLHILFAA